MPLDPNTMTVGDVFVTDTMGPGAVALSLELDPSSYEARHAVALVLWGSEWNGDILLSDGTRIVDGEAIPGSVSREHFDAERAQAAPLNTQVVRDIHGMVKGIVLPNGRHLSAEGLMGRDFVAGRMRPQPLEGATVVERVTRLIEAQPGLRELYLATSLDDAAMLDDRLSGRRYFSNLDLAVLGEAAGDISVAQLTGQVIPVDVMA